MVDPERPTRRLKKVSYSTIVSIVEGVAISISAAAIVTWLTISLTDRTSSDTQFLVWLLSIAIASLGIGLGVFQGRISRSVASARAHRERIELLLARLNELDSEQPGEREVLEQMLVRAINLEVEELKDEQRYRRAVWQHVLMPTAWPRLLRLLLIRLIGHLRKPD